VWSPDGKQIAFIRTAGTKMGELSNLTGGVKFSVWVADAQSGIAKQIWKSPADDGGFAQSYVNTPLAWLASGRILFFSEHSGWNHIYSMTETGSDLKDITPGDGEVESFVADATGKFIYFDGKDINRRHIWKADVTTGTVTAVTTGEGIEMYPALAGTNLYAFRSTSNTSKTLVRVDEASKATVPVYAQKLTTFSSTVFVKPEAVELKAADGILVHAQLFINRNASGNKPGIVFMH
ncbi:MAG TPA: DPP IV N-terminal domain-containing protein, partial [Cyclobacteriaceae bacterium]|nr:DPP IV N-terminal domain-containing protein [Cyclobacteriaceae bacterium]